MLSAEPALQSLLRYQQMICCHLSPVTSHTRYLPIKYIFILTIKSHWQPALCNIYYILITLAYRCFPESRFPGDASAKTPPMAPVFLCTRTAQACCCQLKSALVCCSSHTCVPSVVPTDHSAAGLERKQWHKERD